VGEALGTCFYQGEVIVPGGGVREKRTRMEEVEEVLVEFNDDEE